MLARQALDALDIRLGAEVAECPDSSIELECGRVVIAERPERRAETGPNTRGLIRRIEIAPDRLRTTQGSECTPRVALGQPDVAIGSGEYRVQERCRA